MARDIKENLFEIDSKKIELDFLQQQFLVECKRFTAACIEGKVRAAISANPEKALALGRDGLAPLKKQMNHMLETVSDQVDKILGRDDLWMHRENELDPARFEKDRYGFEGAQGPQILEQALRKLLSPVGGLLIHSGLDTAVNWEEKEGEFLYRHPLDWSREMKQCIENYSLGFNALSDLIAAHKALSEQPTGSDALDLWDSI